MTISNKALLCPLLCARSNVESGKEKREREEFIDLSMLAVSDLESVLPSRPQQKVSSLSILFIQAETETEKHSERKRSEDASPFSTISLPGHLGLSLSLPPLKGLDSRENLPNLHVVPGGGSARNLKRLTHAEGRGGSRLTELEASRGE